MQVVKKRFLLAFCIAFVGFMIAVPTFAEIDVEPQNIGTEENPVEYSTGDIDEVQITLDNIGQDAIDFNVEIEVTAEPEEERANRDDRSEPDDMGWEWRDSDDADGPVFEWVDITEWDGTRHWNLQDDQNTGAVDFGFTFPFWDREFEQIYINSDAWTSFTYGGNSWNNNPQNFPVEAADNAVSATWIHLRQFDYTENNQAWYWTNENDQAIISWIGDGSHNFQLILTDDGKGVMQIGENCDARHLGVNLGDGDHGWHIGSYAAGSAIGFGPADAWTQWIAIDNDGGTIEADERDSLMVTFNFEGMIGGPYEATITIFTTDEEQAEILVPVWLDVTDAADIEVEWAEDAGFPDIINWNNVYRDGIFLDQEYDIPIMIYNVGTENLNIESIASDSNQFTAAPAAEIVIEPEGELEVVITFIAADPDEYQAVMAITSNDPRGVFEIDLIARTAVPPEFVIDPDNVTRTGENSLYTGDYEVYPLTISNDGDADLIWSLEVEVVEEERDNNIRSLRSTSANAPNRDRGSAEPDEWGYEWRDNMNDNESDAPEFEWIDLEEYDDVTDIAMADDVVRGPYDLGWDFPYYDHSGDRVWVCSDGWISPTQGNYTRSFPNYPTANFGDMLTHSGLDWMGNPYPGMFWTDGDGMAVVSYGPNYVSAVNHQIILYDTGLIVFQYGEGWQNNERRNRAFVGINAVVNGNERAGFTVPRVDNYLTNGRVIAFGPEAAWVSWIAVAPEEGEVEGGDEGTVNVTINCSGLIEADYEANITFTTNDPDNETLVVPVLISVIGAPVLVVTWSEDHGYIPPEEDENDESVVDWNLAHPDVFTGGPYEMTVNVANEGTDVLDIEELYIEHAYFDLDVEAETLDPDEDINVTMTFDAPVDDPDDFTATLVLVSDDPGNGQMEVALHARAMLPPTFTIRPDSLGDEDLVTGQIEDYTLTITNEGDALLRWWAVGEVLEAEEERDASVRSLRSADGAVAPRRDEPGDLLGSFQGNNVANQYCNPAGYDWDNNRMFVANYNGQNIHAYTHDNNYEEFEDVLTINAGSCMGGAWANGVFFTHTNGNAQMMRFDSEGDRLDAHQMQHPNYGVAADVEEELLFAMETGNSYAIHVYQLNGDGEVGEQLGIINNHQQYHDNVVVYGLEWVPGHPDGQLWMITYNQNRVSQIFVDIEDDWTCVERVQFFAIGAIGQGHAAVAHDGENMWAGGWTAADIRIYDDGVSEVRWFSFVPEEGTVESDDQADVTVTINCAGLFTGDYDAIIHFTTNDPQRPEVDVPVHMYVTGYGDIDVVWEYGYIPPEEDDEDSEVNWNLRYIDLYSGGPYEMVVEISNIGTDVIDVEELYLDGEGSGAFSIEVADMTLEVEETVVLPITFEVDADAPGEYLADLVLISDDPDESTYRVALHAIAELPPMFSFTINGEDSVVINDELVTGETEGYTIEVTNSGDALLRWWLESEIISEPGDEEERDNNVRTLRRTNTARPQRDDIGDLLYTVSHPLAVNNYKSLAWDYDNNWMWMCEYMGQKRNIAFDLNGWNPEMDEENELPEIVADWNHPGVNPMDCAYYDGVLYYMCIWNAYVGRYDREGNSIGNLNVDLGGGTVNGVAIDRSTGMMIVVHNQIPLNLFQFDLENDGERVGQIGGDGLYAAQGNVWGRVIEFTPDHPDGPLWSGTPNRLHQIAMNQDDDLWVLGDRINNFARQAAQQYDGVAHDGENLWSTNYSSQILQVFDDGITELRWLVYGWGEEGATEGTVESDDQIDIDVLLNAAGLIGGTYIAEMLFTTNDPATPADTITVTIEVTGVPDVDAEWSEEHGFVADELDNVDVENAVLDYNAMYDPDLYNSGPYPFEVTVMNEGTEPLVVDSITFAGDEVWTVDPGELEIAVFSEDIITVTFEADTAGEYSGTFTIFSNDPDEEEVTLAMSATCTRPPQIDLDPQQIHHDLVTGDQRTYQIDVSNGGDATLNFAIEHLIISEGPEDQRDASVRSLRSTSGALGPRRDDPGDLLGEFNGINAANQYCSILGWDRENEMMWVSNYNGQVAAAYTHDANYENFEEVVRIAPGNCMDGTWLNGVLWLGTWGNAMVNLYDAEGDVVGNHQFNTTVYGLGADNENSLIFHMTSEANQPIRVIEVDGVEIGDQIGNITNHLPFHGNQVEYGLEWVPEHGDAPLWMFNYANGTIHQIGVDLDEWQCFDYEDAISFNGGDAFGAQYGAVGHDGVNIWVGAYRPGNIRVYDDGCPETRWLDYGWGEELEKEGSVDPNGNMDIDVVIDCNGLIEGIYEADLIFVCNDPSNPEADVNVRISVTGVPVIGPEWAESAGYVEPVVPGELGENSLIDWNLQYQGTFGLFIGGDYPIPINVINIGTTALEVDDIVVSDESDDYVLADLIAVDRIEFVLDPEGEQEVVLTFSTDPEDDVAEYVGTLTIFSNAHNNDVFEIPIHVETFVAPAIILEPVHIDAQLFTGQSEVRTIDVANNGGYPLVFETEIEITAEPDRDENARSLRSTSGSSAPRRDDFGDEIATLQLPARGANVYKAGIAYNIEDEMMYLTNYTGRRVSAYPADGENYENLEEDHGWGTQLNYMGAGWLDGVLYSVAWSSQFLVRNDAAGENLGNINVPQPTGVTTSQENGWLMTVNAAGFAIRVMTVDGDDVEDIGTITYAVDGIPAQSRSILWVDDHPDQQLWVNTPNHLWNLAVDDNFEVARVQDIVHDGRGDWWCGLGHDGTNIWYGPYQSPDYTIMDDGVAEVRWLAVDPTEGTVDPNGNMDVDVILDATGLISFTYEADILFHSNDPVDETVIVTVELIVEGIPLFDEEFEPILNPFEFADDLIFADTYLGGSNDFIVGIKNGGTEALEIEGYDFSGDNAAAFSTDMDDERILDPAEEYEFTVTLAPEALREDGEMHSCTFHMYSNAMNDDLEEDGHVWWDFFGQAQVPPAAYIVCDDFEEIAEDQWAIEMDMLIGDEPRHVPFIIGNEAGEGRDNLDWFIDIEEVEEEERDASSRTLRTSRNDADGPRRDDPGDILAIFDWPRAPSQSPTFAWNRDTGMMLASTYQGWIDIVDPSDPENPEVIESIQPGLGSQNDCAWLDGIFYICIAGQGRCARFDNNMDRLDGDLQIVANAYGIAADPVNEWFFAKDAWNQNRMHVYAGVVDGELGDELGVVDNYRQYTNNQDPWTINWVPEHENGEFWCHTPSGGGIMSVDIDTEEWTAIEQTYRWADPVANGNWLNGVGHDAYNVWIGISGQNRIWIFDDGIDEVYINWVAVEPDEGITEPGAESELDMIFSTADMEVNFVEYEANVMINTNDPQHEVIVINCKLSVGTRLQNFVDFDETDRVHNILVEDVIFMEESVPVGWEVGVFTEDDVLAGGIVWRADMGETILPAYGATDNHDYFEGGEDFTFKIFDPEAGEDGVEYDWGNAAFTDGPNRWVNNGNSSVVLSFQPVVDQIVHFNDGWNLVSLNIIPVPEFWIDDDGPDTELMCTYGFWDDEEEAWSLEQMKDEHGEFCAPDWGFWGIFYWLPFEGYQLKVVGDRDVTWMGSPIDAQADLAGLGAGWNMMAYYPNYVLPCEFIDDNHEDNFYVLGEIIDRVVIAKDGNADFCMPAWDYSGMADWTGGQGYQINLSEDIEVFNYPLELVEQAAMPGRKVKSLGESHWARLTSTGENMSVLVNSVLGISIDEGDQIASFNLNGDLVGTGMFTNGKCGIGVWGDDIRTDQTDGMLEAEEFVLKLWDADRQLVVDLSVGVVQVGVVNAEGGLEYKRDGILVLDVKVDEAMPTEFSLGQNYPNPFNSTTRMAYEVPELSNVSIQVFDLTGRHVTTLVSEEHHAGRYTAVWEARDITSGIYIVRMKAANFTSVRKVMLVK